MRRQRRWSRPKRGCTTPPRRTSSSKTVPSISVKNNDIKSTTIICFFLSVFLLKWIKNKSNSVHDRSTVFFLNRLCLLFRLPYKCKRTCSVVSTYTRKIVYTRMYKYYIGTFFIHNIYKLRTSINIFFDSFYKCYL